MHCRFYKEFLTNAYFQATHQAAEVLRAVSVVQDSLSNMNKEVQLVGNVVPNSPTKFSVKGSCFSFSTVSLTFTNGKMCARCSNGMCGVAMCNRKSISRNTNTTQEDRKPVCSHIKTMCKEIQVIETIFPEYFQEGDVKEHNFQFPVTPEMEVNNEDGNITQNIPGHFNVNTGLWEYESLSKHTPKDMMDPQNVNCTMQRNDFVMSPNLDPNTGLYSTYHLKPSVLGANGSPIQCNCRSQYSHAAGNAVEKFSSTLYTRTGSVHMKCYNMCCDRGICEIEYSEAAKEKCLFFLTTKTCAGDEIGWDFVNNVLKSKASFTGFCNEMTWRYQATNILAGPFMSPNTFIKWFFAWLAAFKIDFRKEMDPWCGHKPETLACDGTHIGVSLRQMNLRNPVTSPDPTLPVLDMHHQRYDRVLITDTQMRKHLSYLSRKYLRKLKPEEHMDPNIEEERKREFQQNIHVHCDQPVNNFILALVQKSEDQEILYYIARILYMLSGDAAMDAVVPFLCHKLLNTCISDVHQNMVNVQSMEKLRHDGGIDIVKSLDLSIKHGCIPLVTEFWEYVQKKVEKLHKDNNRPSPPVARIPNTYDPSSGSAYYFTEHGEQIRKMPEYRVSGRITTANYDEPPVLPPLISGKKTDPSKLNESHIHLIFSICISETEDFFPPPKTSHNPYPDS